MVDLVIGDAHFGWSSNAVTWLESQLKFFKDQVFKEIEKDSIIERIVFLGDLFDIRYSVNQQVGIEVKNLIRELADNVAKDKEIIFVAGNHDFYSPVEEHERYNAYELVFGNEFVRCHPNIRFVVNEPYYEDGALFLPWYYTENHEKFSDILYQYKNELNTIYCHADLTQWSDARATALRGVNVYAGHIHFIIMDDERKFYNVGACLPLNFNDVNSVRYIYKIKDGIITDKIENTTTLKFKRFFNEDIFTLSENDFSNSTVRLYIYNSNMNKANYIEKLKELRASYNDAINRIEVIDENVKEELELCYFNANVDEFIKSNIPEHLNDKYMFIKEKIEENHTNENKNIEIMNQDDED